MKTFQRKHKGSSPSERVQDNGTPEEVRNQSIGIPLVPHAKSNIQIGPGQKTSSTIQVQVPSSGLPSRDQPTVKATRKRKYEENVLNPPSKEARLETATNRNHQERRSKVTTATPVFGSAAHQILGKRITKYFSKDARPSDACTPSAAPAASQPEHPLSATAAGPSTIPPRITHTPPANDNGSSGKGEHKSDDPSPKKPSGPATSAAAPASAATAEDAGPAAALPYLTLTSNGTRVTSGGTPVHTPPPKEPQQQHPEGSLPSAMRPKPEALAPTGPNGAGTPPHSPPIMQQSKAHSNPSPNPNPNPKSLFRHRALPGWRSTPSKVPEGDGSMGGGGDGGSRGGQGATTPAREGGVNGRGNGDGVAPSAIGTAHVKQHPAPSDHSIPPAQRPPRPTLPPQQQQQLQQQQQQQRSSKVAADTAAAATACPESQASRARAPENCPPARPPLAGGKPALTSCQQQQQQQTRRTLAADRTCAPAPAPDSAVAGRSACQSASQDAQEGDGKLGMYGSQSLLSGVQYTKRAAAAAALGSVRCGPEGGTTTGNAVSGGAGTAAATALVAVTATTMSAMAASSSGGRTGRAIGRGRLPNMPTVTGGGGGTASATAAAAGGGSARSSPSVAATRTQSQAPGAAAGAAVRQLSGLVASGGGAGGRTRPGVVGSQGEQEVTGAPAGGAGAAAKEAVVAQSITEAQERGELLQLQDDALYALDGLRQAEQRAVEVAAWGGGPGAAAGGVDVAVAVREPVAALAAILATRRGRAALSRPTNLAQQALTSLARVSTVQRDAVAALAASIVLLSLVQEDALPAYGASYAAAVLMRQVFQQAERDAPPPVQPPPSGPTAAGPLGPAKAAWELLRDARTATTASAAATKSGRGGGSGGGGGGDQGGGGGGGCNNGSSCRGGVEVSPVVVRLLRLVSEGALSRQVGRPDLVMGPLPLVLLALLTASEASPARIQFTERLKGNLHKAGILHLLGRLVTARRDAVVRHLHDKRRRTAATAAAAAASLTCCLRTPTKGTAPHAATDGGEGTGAVGSCLPAVSPHAGSPLPAGASQGTRAGISPSQRPAGTGQIGIACEQRQQLHQRDKGPDKMATAEVKVREKEEAEADAEGAEDPYTFFGSAPQSQTLPPSSPPPPAAGPQILPQADSQEAAAAAAVPAAAAAANPKLPLPPWCLWEMQLLLRVLENATFTHGRNETELLGLRVSTTLPVPHAAEAAAAAVAAAAQAGVGGTGLATAAAAAAGGGTAAVGMGLQSQPPHIAPLMFMDSLSQQSHHLQPPLQQQQQQQQPQSFLFAGLDSQQQQYTGSQQHSFAPPPLLPHINGSQQSSLMIPPFSEPPSQQRLELEQTLPMQDAATTQHEQPAPKGQSAAGAVSGEGDSTEAPFVAVLVDVVRQLSKLADEGDGDDDGSGGGGGGDVRQQGLGSAAPSAQPNRGGLAVAAAAVAAAAPVASPSSVCQAAVAVLMNLTHEHPDGVAAVAAAGGLQAIGALVWRCCRPQQQQRGVLGAVAAAGASGDDAGGGSASGSGGCAPVTATHRLVVCRQAIVANIEILSVCLGLLINMTSKSPNMQACLRETLLEVPPPSPSPSPPPPAPAAPPPASSPTGTPDGASRLGVGSPPLTYKTQSIRAAGGDGGKLISGEREDADNDGDDGSSKGGGGRGGEQCYTRIIPLLCAVLNTMTPEGGAAAAAGAGPHRGCNGDGGGGEGGEGGRGRGAAQSVEVTEAALCADQQGGQASIAQVYAAILLGYMLAGVEEGGSGGGCEVGTPTAAAAADDHPHPDANSQHTYNGDNTAISSGPSRQHQVRTPRPCSAADVRSEARRLLEEGSLRPVTRCISRCLAFYCRAGAITDDSRESLTKLLQRLLRLEALENPAAWRPPPAPSHPPPTSQAAVRAPTSEATRRAPARSTPAAGAGGVAGGPQAAAEGGAAARDVWEQLVASDDESAE